MYTCSLKLKEYKAEVLNELKDWFDNRQQVLRWGGPSLSYPLNNEALHEELHRNGFVSYGLYIRHKFIGFGQLKYEPNHIHLARLVINPVFRNQGLSTELIRKLIQEAKRSSHIKSASLLVYQDNIPALKAYSKVGFEERDRSILTFPSTCTYLQKRIA